MENYNKDLIVIITDFTKYIVDTTETLFNKDGSIVTAAHILTKKGNGFEYSCVPANSFMSSTTTKNVFSSMMKEIGNKPNIVVIIFVAESWVSVVPKDSKLGDNMDELEGIIPSEDPNRKEAIMFSINSVVNNDLKVILIEREEDKFKLVRHIGFDGEKDTYYTGRFSNLIGKKDTILN